MDAHKQLEYLKSQLAFFQKKGKCKWIKPHELREYSDLEIDFIDKIRELKERMAKESLAEVNKPIVSDSKTAVDLAVIATGAIDAMNEKETMRQAREDIKTIARLFAIDAETLWKAAFEEWYRIGREARKVAS